MKKHILSVLCCCLMLCVLAACSNQSNNGALNSSTINPSVSTTSDVTSSDDENSSVPDITTSVPTTEESSTGTSTPETTESSAPETSERPTPETSNPPVTEPPTTNPPETKPPVTKPPETTPPETEPPVTEKPDDTPPAAHAQKVTATLSAYTSANEPTPYLKGKAIYQILYGGERAQIGDTLKFNLTVEPANHTDTISVTVTDNISYSLLGNTLTVSVNSFGDIGSGRVTIYVCDSKTGAIRTSTKISFAIDAAGNPYDNPSSIFSSYIRALGMSYTTVSEGYTTADPSLSFTQFAGAPAWDDQILKSESNWLNRCFWLLEKYADSGFKKVNFIETSISFGFSASK